MGWELHIDLNGFCADGNMTFEEALSVPIFPFTTEQVEEKKRMRAQRSKKPQLRRTALEGPAGLGRRV